MVLRRLNRNSEPQASIESGQYTLQYVSQFNCHVRRTKVYEEGWVLLERLQRAVTGWQTQLFELASYETGPRAVCYVSGSYAFYLVQL